jgi:hypothetical protein
MRDQSDKAQSSGRITSSFAKVYRGAGSYDTTSQAELELFNVFERFSDEFTIFHGVKWIAYSQGSVGEIDFLIAHPSFGVLVLEVKGGAVSIEQGHWFSTDRNGIQNEIHDPCAQADRNRWALRDWLANEPLTKGVAFTLFPAVALPNSRVAGNIRPDCPSDIFIDIMHLGNLEARVRTIFKYWMQHTDRRNDKMDGKRAIDALTALLIPTRNLHPRIAHIFEQERRVIEELTEQQFMVLRLLRTRKRAAIVGGAGTGKTMLAMEKCQQLLNAGLRVLFLCFNQNLKQWLEASLSHPNVMFATFHGIVGRALHWAKVTKPDGDFYNQSADLLNDATIRLRSENSDRFFDAIIVDEAQDFEDTWWIPLPDLLKDPESGSFYVFFDDNQRIYTQISNMPLSGEPLFLSDNCRNTQHIHKSLAPYMQDRYDTICKGPEGRPIEVLPADTPTRARKVLQSVLHRLVNEDEISSQDIVILTTTSEKRSQWKQSERLGNFVLTWQFHNELPNAIRVSSIHSYKGLESAVVILTELDMMSRDDIHNQLIYVGLSRARHHVVVVGDLPLPTAHPTDEEK